MSGGIDTRRPANRLPPSRSPDLLNVAFNRRAVEKRGGFVPFVTDRIPGSGVRNKGKHSRTQIADDGSPGVNPADVPEIEQLIVPGRMLAGHRSAFSQLKDSFCLDFFCSPEDLTERWAGNGGDEFANNPLTPIAGNLGYQIKARPIIAKGPSKMRHSNSEARADNEFGPKMWVGTAAAGAEHRGAIHWNNTRPWGPEPECLEIIGIAGTSPNWQVTTSRPHGLSALDQVKFIATGSGVDGIQTVSGVINSSTFTISVAAVSPAAGAIIKSGFGGPYYGCPFAVYLYWNGTEWVFRFSFHVINGANFEIRNLESAIEVREGAKYHVLASYDEGATAILRVGVWDEIQQQFVYAANATDSLSGTSSCEPSTGPVMVFDMPSPLMDEPAAASTLLWDGTSFSSMGPGIAAAGDHHISSVVRFEGLIDDIAIWKDPLSGADKDRKEALEGTEDSLLCFWPTRGGGDRLLKEATGVGNHLYVSPDIPVFDGISGSTRPEEGTLWFNGECSYILADTDSPSWNEMERRNELTDIPTTSPGRNTNVEGAFSKVVRDVNIAGYGLQVEFWCDSFEPFEQVLVEVLGVMRIAIRPDGRIAVYSRGDEACGVGVPPTYQLPAVTDDPIELGRRYHVVGFRIEDKTRIYVQNVLVAEEQTLGVYGDPQAHPAGGLIIGAGVREVGAAWWTDSVEYILPADGEPTSNDVNTDSRSHFLGRIEQVSVVVGSPDRTAVYKDQDFDDSRVEAQELWSYDDDFIAPYNNPTTDLLSVSPGDRSVELVRGHMVRPPHEFDRDGLGKRIVYFLDDVSGLSVLEEFARAQNGGLDAMIAGRVDFMHQLARFSLSKYDRDRITAGRWMREIEMRDNNWEEGAAAPITPGEPVRDSRRWVYELESAISDELDVLGKLYLRCSDPLNWCESRLDLGGTYVPKRSQPEFRYRNLPWLNSHPTELQPHRTAGIAIPLEDSGEVTMVKEWEHTPTRERVVVVAGEHAIHEAAPIWFEDSPFDEVNPRSLRSLYGGFVHVNTDNPTSSDYEVVGGETCTISIWIKPIRLDGIRLIAVSGLYDSSLVNYVIYTRDGSLCVAGDAQDGGGDAAWVYEQGLSLGGAMSRQSSLRVNAWNHVYITIGDAAISGRAVLAWINGEPVTMSVYDDGVYVANSLGSITSNSGLGQKLFLLGAPNGLNKIQLPNSGVDLDLEFDSFYGLLAEFVQTNDDLLSASEGIPVKVPSTRLSGKSSAKIGLSFNVDSGRYLENQSPSASSPAGDAYVDIRDVGLIGDGIFSVPDQPMNGVVYRDRLFATNGQNRPLEIEITRRTDPKGMFRLQPMGMQVPGSARDSNIPDVLEDLSFIDFGLRAPYHPDREGINYLGPGLYSVWLSMVDENDRESEPVQIIDEAKVDVLHTTTISNVVAHAPASGRATNGNEVLITISTGYFIVDNSANSPQAFTVKITGGANPDIQGVFAATPLFAPPYTGDTQFVIDIGTPSATVDTTTGDQVEIFLDGFTINGLPRSEDPHVVKRRLYVSPFGGGAPVFHSDIPDNDSWNWEIWGPGGVYGDSGIVLEVGRRLPPPRARLIAAGSGIGQIVLGNLPKLSTGPNAIAWSDAAEQTYFPFNNAATIDSTNGKPIIGMGAHRGRFFIMKRDSTWAFVVRSAALDIGSLISIVDQSTGFGGALVIYDERFFGAGERGIHMFDGNTQQFISQALEGLWGSDTTLSDEDLLEATGVFFKAQNRYAVSLRREGEVGNRKVFVLHTTVSSDDGTPPFSIWEVPAHRTLEAIVHPVTNRPVVMMGTVNGSLLVYDENQFVDGAFDEGDLHGEVTGSEVTATSLDLSAFDVQRVAPGTEVFLSYGDVTVSRKVRSHQRKFFNSTPVSLIEWDEPLLAVPSGGETVAWTIGGFDAFWSTSWIGPRARGEWVNVKGLDLEFSPTECDLTIQNVAAIDSAAGQAFDVVSGREMPSLFNEQSRSLADGFLRETVKFRGRERGRYVRFLIGTFRRRGSGVRNPFRVSLMHVRMDSQGKDGRPA